MTLSAHRTLKFGVFSTIPLELYRLVYTDRETAFEMMRSQKPTIDHEG